jgi:hypothetical protein
MVHRDRLMVVAVCTVLAAAVLFGPGGAGPAAAQRQGPCADDVAKFCKDVPPGGGRIARCLKLHEKDLSTTCKQQVAEVKKRGQEFRAACEDDVFKLCGNVQPGGGRILSCLKQHEQELTPDCRSQMQQKRGTKAK